jgi:cytoskeletal protein RodZ
MKEMTKSTCAAMGLAASILMGGCAGNASSRGSDEHPTGSQSAANAPSADASSASNKASATNPDASASATNPSASAMNPSSSETNPSSSATNPSSSATNPSSSASAAPAANAPGANAASQGTGSNAPSNERRGEFQGRIARLDRADNAMIAGSESVGLAFEEFKLDDKTQVTTPSGKGTVAELSEGDEVRASFSGSGEDLHVDKLQVLTPKPTEAGAER